MKATFIIKRAIEIFLLLWIISSLFYNPADKYGYIFQPWFNNTGKIAIIAIIIGCSFIDLQLAIILTIAFLILIISFSKKNEFSNQNFENSATFPAKPYHTIKSVPGKFEPDRVVSSELPRVICDVTPYDPEAINDKIYEYSRDPKFDDYDEFIRMLSSPDQIQSAQDNTPGV